MTTGDNVIRLPLVASKSYPSDVVDGKEALERAGAVFGQVVEDANPLFQYVALPRGWTKIVDTQPHTVVDGRGRIRVYISLDREGEETSFHGNRRYRVELRAITKTSSSILVLDWNGSIIYQLRTTPVYRSQRDKAEAWLDEQFPRWRDPSAYWDEASGEKRKASNGG